MLQDDYYWHLSVEQAFDVHREPSGLTMGQLSNDLGAVSPAEEPEPHSAWHELAHLGAMHPVIVNAENEDPGREGSIEPLPRSRGRWPVLLATAVAMAGPVVFVIFPSEVMFWVMWLFFVPLVVLAAYVFKKAEDEDAPEDTNHPRAEGVWLPPSDF